MSLALFKRNLAKCGTEVTLQNRAIVPPDFDAIDFDQSFSDDATVQAIINTQRGTTLFDGVATDTPVTHKICIEYIPGVTAETWILFGSRRFDILDVENCGEQDKCLVLRCTERGTKKAAEA